MQIDLRQIDDWIVWLGGICLALAAIAFVLRGAYRFFYKHSRMYEMMERELTQGTNGGGKDGIKDVVDEIAGDVKKIDKDVKQLKSRTAHIETRMRGIERKVEDIDGDKPTGSS